MKLPWRRRSPDEPQETRDISIDITAPRECFYKTFEDHPGPCPRCGSDLQQSYQSYMVAARRGRRATDSFVTGSDMGWFCPQCPTLVVNPEAVSEVLQYSLPHWDSGDKFTLLGIVDLDAIPEEKRDLPLGGDDNPYPLVRFTRISREAKTPRLARAAQKSPARRDDLPFEERYEDVLQNIEFGIIRVYREHPEMTDWDVLSAVESLLRIYRAEAKGRQPKTPSLVPLAQQVYESTAAMCDMRLGRGTLVDEDSQPVDLDMQILALDEIVACLKRIRKSINFWTKERGRRGYLTYVEQFIA